MARIVQTVGIQKGAGTSIAASFAATPTVGNHLVAVVCGWSSTLNAGLPPGSVADNQGNAYSLFGGVELGAGGAGDWSSGGIFYARAATASGVVTVTATLDAAGDLLIGLVEVAGVSTTGTVRGSSSSTSNVNPRVTGQVAVQPGDAAFALVTQSTALTSSAVSAGWSVLYQELPATFTSGEGDYRIVRDAGMLDAEWLVGAVGNTIVAQIGVLAGVPDVPIGTPAWPFPRPPRRAS
jgi:hypothetical protein